MARLRRRVVLILALPLVGLVFARRPVESRIESALRARIAAEARRRGLQVEVGELRAGLYPLLRLRSVRALKPGAFSVEIPGIEVRLRLPTGSPGWLRVGLEGATIEGPQDLSVKVAPTEWNLGSSPPGGITASLASGALWVTWFTRPGREGRLEVGARDFPADTTLSVKRQGVTILEGGVVRGFGWTERNTGSTAFGVDVAFQDLRLAAFSGEALARGEAPVLGRATDLALRFQGSWEEGALRLPRFSGASEGAAISGALALTGVPHDPSIHLALEVQRLDFAKVLVTAGLSPTTAVLGPDTGDLGSASLAADIRGRLLDPNSFEVAQKIDFSPPARFPPEIERLRADFVHEVTLPDGRRRAISVAPSSPDFISFRDVPPLFLRTLLIGEDAGFYSHRGIDLREVPSAVLTNWARGTVARGASTITQQLAKNLFLSREKRLSRKVQELALSLLLESSLGKERILEIYLNIIEWGPELYGLRPAARHYFHKEPGELDPKQTAFLVALIPGPVKYQRAFAQGSPAAWFLPLVNDLLFKLRSVDALSQEEYDAAIDEPLLIATTEEEIPPAQADVQ